MTAPSREACAYAGLYCEENVWQLARRDDLLPGQRSAIFVCNPRRSVAMWAQRLGGPGAPVVWDYHVVLAVQDDLQTWIYDLDSHARFPCEAVGYLRATFPVPDLLPEELQPRFRVVPVEALFETFASDRAHMLDEAGAYRAPPPPWPPIRPEGAPSSTLDRFLDLEDDIAGLRLGLDGLIRWCGPSDARLSS